MNQINMQVCRYAGGGRNVNMGLKTRIFVGINYNVLMKGISQVLPQPISASATCYEIENGRFFEILV